jgi:hypothetical protein
MADNGKGPNYKMKKSVLFFCEWKAIQETLGTLKFPSEMADVVGSFSLFKN